MHLAFDLVYVLGGRLRKYSTLVDHMSLSFASGIQDSKSEFLKPRVSSVRTYVPMSNCLKWFVCFTCVRQPST